MLTSMQAAIDAEVAAREALQAALDGQATQAKAHAADQAMALETTKDRIDQLERMAYGQRSERAAKTPDARRDARRRVQNERSDEEKKAQQRAASAARQAKLDALSTVNLNLMLDPGVPTGRPLPPEESVIYDWRRSRLVRIVVRREQRVTPNGEIVTAPPPPQVIEGGCYGPAQHAKVAVDKCLDVMPLRRQERAFERRGAPLPVSVLCALFHRSAQLVEPLYEAMMTHVRNAGHVAADETPQPVIDEEKTRKGWMWVFATDEALLYVYSPSRGGKVPEGVLGASSGTITVDGHTGYNLVTTAGRRKRGGCWSHGRRGLFDARDYDEALVNGLLTQIGELFYVEQLAIEPQIVGTDAHLALRQAQSAPVIASIYATVEHRLGDFDERSSLAKAMRYLVNQRAPLSLFLTDARVPIHNNLSERALRVVALLRKNALFVGSDDGGTNLAMLLSMTATCRLHDMDPEVWLADVLIAVSEPGLTAEDLLPWNWKTGRGKTARPTFDTG